MIVDCAAYEGGCRVADVGLDQLREWTERAGASVWVGLFEPSEEELRTAQGQLGLHDLAIEDAHQAHQRPKLEEYGDGLFLVLRTARWIEEKKRVERKCSRSLSETIQRSLVRALAPNQVRPKVLTSTLRTYRRVRTCTILRLCSGGSAIPSDFAQDFAGISGTTRALFPARANRPSTGGTTVPVQGLFTDKGGKPE